MKNYNGNSLTWKNVKYFMDLYNPYKENGDSESYNNLYNTIKYLAVFNFEKGNELFSKVSNYDHDLFLASIDK